jgi:hypothetical protein
VAIASSTQFTVQRGWMPQNPPTNQTTLTLTMSCGVRNVQFFEEILWNYEKDPVGANTDFTTVVDEPTVLNGHHYIGGGVFIAAGGFSFTLGATVCPVSASECLQIRPGNLYTAQFSPSSAISINPPFAGVSGIGSGNQVDTHPGPCFSLWCTDARPMLGGTPTNLGATTPFVNVSGQLWKVSGAQTVMNRKFLATMAYVGRSPLVDISGPSSSIGSGATDSYKYCYAAMTGECVTGAAVGDVYVNAPYVAYPFCFYPGIAIYGDDTNSICIGDLGAYTGNAVQMSVTQHDLSGALIRRLGPDYAKWNQMDVFWNVRPVPSGGAMASQVRWLDGVRTENLTTVMPPMPAPDSVSRNTFYGIQVVIKPPAGLPVQSAIVEFGYVENGDAGSYYCTSRRETCVATTSSVDPSAPFHFEQTETFSPAPCSTGCTIAIPALPGHIVYYRWKYLGAGGQVIESSQAHVAITP